MKQTLKILTALLVIATLVMAFSACGSKKTGGTDNTLLQGIFEKLTANAEYSQWKSGFGATTIEEKLDGDSIVISAKGEEGVNGDFIYTLDGDYLVNTSDAGDYTGYSVMMFIKNAVADYYGMNSLLMTGYLAGLDFAGKENTFFTTESVDGKTVLKLYVASAWDMKGLDEMIVDDAALEYTDALTDNAGNSFINAGKITVASWGSKDELELVVGEYGENTELTFRSLQNVVAKLQPNGYEAFAKDYTQLEEAVGNGYSVKMELTQNIVESHDYAGEDGYSYVTVTFGAATSGED